MYIYFKVFLLCLQVIAEKYAIVEMTEPCIPGFLAFHEVDHLLGCIKQLEACRTLGTYSIYDTIKLRTNMSDMFSIASVDKPQSFTGMSHN